MQVLIDSERLEVYEYLAGDKEYQHCSAIARAIIDYRLARQSAGYYDTVVETHLRIMRLLEDL